jgi:hypothetical protein
LRHLTYRAGFLITGVADVSGAPVHRKSSNSDIYALRNPANVGVAQKATESIIDDIEGLCPGAFTAPLPQLLEKISLKRRAK